MPTTLEMLDAIPPMNQDMGDNLTLPSTFERQQMRTLPMTPEMSSQDRETNMFSGGISPMQEKEFNVDPQTMSILTTRIDQALMNDPEIPNEVVSAMSPSNKMEFIEQIIQEASQIPDEEVSSMPLEKEQESENIINKLLGKGASEKLNQMGNPQDINFAPMGMNYGGPAKQYYNMGGATHTMPDGTVHPGATHEEYEQMLAGGMPMRMNHGGLASMGRMEDTELAHVAPGERIVPAEILGQKGNEMLDAAFIRAGLDPIEYTAGSGQQSINPMTGMPEYTSFFKRLLRKIKKVAPAIGSVVGFSMGGNMGAAIGKTIGGVIKSGDVDFQDALTDFGTGWALGNFATGMGMQGGQGIGSIFKKGVHTIKQGDTLQTIADEYGVTAQEIIDANPGAMPVEGATLKIPGGMWGIRPTSGQEGVGGFIQNAGAKLGGALGGKGAGNIDLVEQFKDLPTAKKLGVGALGLAALSQTGMFDTPDSKGTPEEITTGIQDIQEYTSRPLTVFNTDQQLGQNAPTINIPQLQTNTSPRNKTLMQVLEQIGSGNIGYQPSPVSFG
jgi:LysM repeat protein